MNTSPVRDAVVRRHQVNVVGEGSQTLVLAHGFGCDQTVWRFMVPLLQSRYRLVLFDFVGSGGSDLSAYDPQRHANLEGYAQDLAQICTALGLEAPVFVGHSASSMIGALASVGDPGLFSRLVMIGPSPCYINQPPAYVGGFEHTDIVGLLDMMDHNYIGWAEAMAPVIMKNDDRPDLGQELAQNFCRMDADIARRWARAIFLADHRERLPRVSVPTLILQCADDALAPVSVGRYMQACMPGSTLREMRATGHCPHMSEPEETVALLDDYLTGARP